MWNCWVCSQVLVPTNPSRACTLTLLTRTLLASDHVTCRQTLTRTQTTHTQTRQISVWPLWVTQRPPKPTMESRSLSLGKLRLFRRAISGPLLYAQLNIDSKCLSPRLTFEPERQSAARAGRDKRWTSVCLLVTTLSFSFLPVWCYICCFCRPVSCLCQSPGVEQCEDTRSACAEVSHAAIMMRAAELRLSHCVPNPSYSCVYTA